MGVLQHLSSGKSIVLAAYSVVGRAEDSLVLRTHAAVSREHASLFWTGRQWEVRDLGSANGTHLNNEKLMSGKDHPVRLDSIIRFGSDEERWKLVDDRGPVASARCLETGVERYGESGVLALPDDDNVLATITKNDDGRFVLDLGDDDPRLVDSDERLTIAGQEWVLTLPPATPIAGTYKQPTSLTIQTIWIHLYVSLDEEHVRVEIVHEGERFDLGRRSCFCALHVLARQRREDHDGCQLGDEECGWMEVEDLRLETAESERALNVSINRIREEFKEAGVEDGQALIDSTSRRGKRRLTTNRFTIVSG